MELPPDNLRSKNNFRPSASFSGEGGLNAGEGGIAVLLNASGSGAAKLCVDHRMIIPAKPLSAHVRTYRMRSLMRPKLSGLPSTWNCFQVEGAT